MIEWTKTDYGFESTSASLEDMREVIQYFEEMGPWERGTPVRYAYVTKTTEELFACSGAMVPFDTVSYRITVVVQDHHAVAFKLRWM